MKTGLLTIALVCAVAAAGCGKKDSAAAADSQAAVDSKPLAAVAKGAPEVEVMVKHAVTALETKDEVTAVMTLRDVRSNPKLSDEQLRTINDTMKNVYVNLSERAARGDQRAAMQLQMLNMNRQ